MSIVANKDTRVVIQGGAAGVNAARRMAEFCYLIKRPLNVEAFVYPPDAGKTNEIPYGSGLLAIPIYRTVADATKHHPQINTSLVYIGADRAMAAGLEAINNEKIQLVSMITEGVPEKDAKILARQATKLGKVFNGPSSIGIISAGACRLGVIGGQRASAADAGVAAVVFTVAARNPGPVHHVDLLEPGFTEPADDLLRRLVPDYHDETEQ